MKIFLTSCETGPNAWRHQEGVLRALWERSDKTHALVDSADAADLILVGNIRAENDYASLRAHPIINRHPHKCFAVSEAWDFLPLLRGIYTNAHRKLPFPARFRSGSYALYHPDFKNPFIEQHGGRAFEQPKTFLTSFTGRDCHPARAAIFATRFRRPDIHVSDSSDFNAFTHDQSGKAPRQRAYVELLEQSKFSLCPRGCGAASIRLFESMKIGVAPVIISDDWIRPHGPDWSKCAITIRERDLASLEDILVAHEPRYREIGRAASEAYAAHFSPPAYFNFIVTQACDIEAAQLLPESVQWKFRHARVKLAAWQRKLRARAPRSRPGQNGSNSVHSSSVLPIEAVDAALSAGVPSDRSRP